MSEIAILNVPQSAKNGHQRPEKPRVHLWTRAEYGRMIDVGLFDDLRVELIEGEIIEMAPMHGPHATGVRKISAAFFVAFDEEPFAVGSQVPIAIGEKSEPEPDLYVARGSNDDYARDHPQPDNLLLVVEVSVSTLAEDLNKKLSLYARAQIPEYWVLNVEARQLEIYRQPALDESKTYGWGYAEQNTVPETGEIAPLFAPQTSFQVARFLPRATESENL